MTIFTDKAKVYLPRLMTDLNITKAQAAGIFGNIGTETGGFTALQEKNPTVKGSRGGYGWEQWTGDRRVKYEAWCKVHKFDPSLDETNYQYVVNESKLDEVHSLVQLRKTTTIEAATETWMKQNLRPGVPNLKSRIAYAHQAFDAVQQDSKSTLSTGATATIGAGTIVAGSVITNNPAITTHPNHTWGWVIVGGLVAIALAWWLIEKIHNAQHAAVTKGS